MKKPPSNPLLTSGGSFSLSDSFNVAAPLPGQAEEDSFLGGNSNTTAGAINFPAPLARPPSTSTLFSPQAVPLSCPATPLSPPPSPLTLPPTPSVLPPTPAPAPLPAAHTPLLFNPSSLPGAGVTPQPRRPSYTVRPSCVGASVGKPSLPPPLPSPLTPSTLPQPLTPTTLPQLPPPPLLPSSSLPAPSLALTPQGPPTPSLAPSSVLSPPSLLPPLTAHWFYLADAKTEVWKPLSVEDSTAVEAAMERGDTSQGIPCDGSRYDVLVEKRIRVPVYWSGAEQEVRRCSWFHRAPSDTARWVPYPEAVAERLEQEYGAAVKSGNWQIKVMLESGDWVMLHSPEYILHFPAATSGGLDDWGQLQQNSDPSLGPRIVNRGLEGLPDVPDGESQEVDHLVFVVHGIGAACDIKFRPIAEVVDGLRAIAGDMADRHFAGAKLASTANRVEFLPINWHDKLHGETSGTDARIQPLTLRSIPKLRGFVNDTLLDVLFYTSPVYCQTILNTVAEQINSVYKLFCARNPGFSSGVSVIGHSLGSVILFDLLCGQVRDAQSDSQPPEDISPMVKPVWDKDLTLEQVFEKLNLSEYTSIFTDQGIGLSELSSCSPDDLEEAGLGAEERERLSSYLGSRASTQSGYSQFIQSSVVNSVSYCVGPAGTGQPSVTYPTLDMDIQAFFALGSPIGVFMAVRGVESLGPSFSLPTCSRFFNIFHPYDPIAYRVESLVDAGLSSLRPSLIPHHMGRKRMHLELKETMTRVGSDIRQKVMDGLKATMGAVYSVAGTLSGQQGEQEQAGGEVAAGGPGGDTQRPESPETTELNVALNKGSRVDYVLQEAPMESFNEYLFAVASHLVYWNSEDTVLLVIKEIYNSIGVSSDDQLGSHSQPPLVASSYPSQSIGAYPEPPTPALSPQTQQPNPTNVGYSSFPGAPPSLPPSAPLPVAPSAYPPSFHPSQPPPTLFNIDAVSSSVNKSRSPFSTARPLAGPAPVVGMDPTAPILSDKPLPPPPKIGFQR